MTAPDSNASLSPTESNRKLWDTWAHLNAASRMYDLEGFKKTRDSLQPLETNELLDVRDKRLLHLMCHIGLDSISWAHRGARVTGVDFSPESIKLARQLAKEVGVPVDFICADVLALPQALPATFDIVFASYGILNWIPDLPAWTDVVCRYMRPGSIFYIVDYHPISRVLFPREQDDAGNALESDYFGRQTAVKVEEWGSYANYDETKREAAYYWYHTLGDFVSALAAAGLRIDYVHEFPAPASLVIQKNPRNFDLNKVPYFFSVHATK